MPRNLDLVFKGRRGQRLAQSTVIDREHGYWPQVARAAGHPDAVLYSLRHFAAHYLYVKLGLPARAVACQMGHVDGGRLVETLYGHGDHGALDTLRDAFKGQRAGQESHIGIASVESSI